MKDTLGRENRKIADRRCNECGKVYRPKRESSHYCSRACRWKNNGKNQGQAIDHETWWVNSKGYVEGRVWRNGKCLRMKQARWVMEQYLGRPLSRREVPHHKNEIKTDNRIENLELKEFGKHSAEHNRNRIHKKGYKLNLSNEERQKRREHMLGIHKARHQKFLTKIREQYAKRRENEQVRELQEIGGGK